MSVLLRYICFQVPGALLVTAGAAILHVSFDLSLAGSATIIIGWLAKDVVMYPFVRESYVSEVPTGTERLLGLSGVAIDDIRTQGYVRVAGERWRARIAEGAGEVLAGQSVCVVGCEGMWLIVEGE